MIFFSHAMSCILWRHYNLAFNRIISLFLKLSQSLLILSQREHLNIFHKNKLNQKKMIKMTFWHDEKTSWNKKLKREMNVMRLIELREVMWHIEHVEHRRSRDWECMMLMLSMLSMMHVEHVEHDIFENVSWDI